MGYREDQQAEAKVLGFLPTGRTSGEDDLIKMLDKQVETDAVITEFSSLTDKTEISNYVDNLYKTGRSDLLAAILENPNSAKVLKPFTKKNDNGNFSLVFPPDAQQTQTAASLGSPVAIGSSASLQTSDILQIANSISNYQGQAEKRISSFEAAGVASGKAESTLAANESARLKETEEALGFLLTAQTEATAEAMVKQKKLVEEVASDPAIQAQAGRLNSLLLMQDAAFAEARAAKNREQELRNSFSGRILAGTGGEESLKRYFPELTNAVQDVAFVKAQQSEINAAIEVNRAAMASHLKFRQDLAAIKTPEEIKAEGLAVKFKTQQVLESAQRGVDVTNVEVAKAQEKRVLEATKLVEDANSKIAQLQIQLGNLKLGADKTAINAEMALMRSTLIEAQTRLTNAKAEGQQLKNDEWLSEGITAADAGKATAAAKILLGLPESTSTEDTLKQYKAFGDKDSKKLFSELLSGKGKQQGLANLEFYQAVYANPRLKPVLAAIDADALRIFEKTGTRNAVLQMVQQTDAAVSLLAGEKRTRESLGLAYETVTKATAAGASSPEVDIKIVDAKDKTKSVTISNPFKATLAGVLVDPATVEKAGLIGTDAAASQRLATSPLYNALYLKEIELKKIKGGEELDIGNVLNVALELSSAVKTDEEKKKLAMDAVDVVRLAMASSYVTRGLTVTNFPKPTDYQVTIEQRGLFTRIKDALKADVVATAASMAVPLVGANLIPLAVLNSQSVESKLRNFNSTDMINQVRDSIPTKEMKVDLTDANQWLSMFKFIKASTARAALEALQTPTTVGP